MFSREKVITHQSEMKENIKRREADKDLSPNRVPQIYTFKESQTMKDGIQGREEEALEMMILTMPHKQLSSGEHLKGEKLLVFSEDWRRKGDG